MRRGNRATSVSETMMVRPRLLHVFSTFDYGGAEARTVALINHWGDRLEHDLWVGVPDAMGAAAAIAPGIIHQFPADGAALVLGRPGWRRYYRIAQALRGYQLILTYSWGAMDVAMAHRLFGRALGLAPLIHHKDGFNQAQHARRRQWKDRFRRIALSGAYRLVVPSHSLATIAREQWHMPGHQIARIANGIDVAAFAGAASPTAIPGFVRRDGAVVIGAVAGLRTIKNLPRLVRAVAAATGDLQLVIVGEGPARADIVAEAARCGLSDVLLMPGFMTDPASFVGLFDIFALSSDSEQHPLAILEAMAAGLPVVSTDVGDVRHMVAPDNLPFIVPCNDEAALAGAVTTLARDADLRAQLGRQNRQIAERDGQATDMIAAYQRLYGGAMRGDDPWRGANG
jgi:L-malate glycosyltransferase